MKYYLISLIFLSAFFSSSAQCLSGTYTIGGSSPDYPSFQSAFDALGANGVCGATVFYVSDGVYNEQATLEYFSNSSPSNVVFISASQDSTLAVLSNPSSDLAADNFTLKLNNVVGVSFFKLGFIRDNNLDLDFSSVVQITGTSSDVFFLNCHFETKENLYHHELIYSDTLTQQNEIRIEGNYFKGGSKAVVLGNFGALEVDFENQNYIAKNVFFNQNHRALDLRQQSGLIITENLIEKSHCYMDTLSLDSIYTAIYLNDPSRMEVSRNKIMLKHDGVLQPSHFNTPYFSHYTSFYCKYFYDTNFIINNFFINSSPISSKLVSLPQIQNNTPNYDMTLSILNNSFYSNNNSEIDLINWYTDLELLFSNNLIKVDTSKSFRYKYFGAKPKMDNNIYDVFESFQDSLAKQRSIGLDSNSKFLKIPYVDSLNDLHILYDNEIRNNGQYNSNILTDFDGQNRIGDFDIGADEFPTFGGFDYGIASINDYHFFNGVCPGEDSIQIVVKNYGSLVYSKCLIHVQVDDSIYNPISYNSLLPSNAYDTIVFPIEVPDIWTGQITVSVSDSNGVFDPNVYNNIKGTSFYTLLHGSYDVGAGLDFENSHIAMERIATKGICGDVILNLYDTLYNYGVIDSIKHMRDIDTLSFVGKSANLFLGGGDPITPNFSVNGGVDNNCSIKGNGTFIYKGLWFKYAAIADGKHLIADSCFVIENLSPILNYPHLSGFVGGDNIEIKNCQLNSAKIRSVADIPQNMTFENNICVNSVIELGDDSLGRFSKVIINNNQFETNVSGYTDTLIMENNISSPSTVVPELEITVYTHGFINNNTLRFKKFKLSGNFEVSNNLIFPLTNNYQFTFGSMNKIYPCKIFNNSFKQEMSTNGSFSSYFEFSDFQVPDSIQIVNNNFSLTNNRYFLFRSGSKFVNNILNVELGHQNLLFQHSNPTNTDFENNIFFYDTSDIDFAYGINSLEEAIIQGMPFTGSVFKNLDVLSDNIHTPIDSAILGKGKFYSGMSLIDIEGDIRDSNRIDIGADQHVFPSSIDLSLNISPNQTFCDGDSLFVYVHNNSLDSLYWFSTQLYIDSILIDTKEHYPFIAASDSILVFAGMIDYQQNFNNSVSISTLKPNYSQDINLSNDTIAFLLNAFEGVDITSDFVVACQNDITEISVQDYFQSYLWSDGSINDTTQLILPGYYYVEATDNNGCLSFDSIEYINHFPYLEDVVKCPLENYSFQLPNLYSNTIWNNGVIGNSIDFYAEGLYSIVTQDTLGCSFMDTLEVSFTMVPDIIPFEDTISCTDVFNYTLGNNYINILWSSISSLTYLGNQVNLPSGKFIPRTYYVSAKDNITGCALRDTFDVQTALTTIVQPATVSPCVGTTLTLEAPISSAYLWYGPSFSTSQTYNLSSVGIVNIELRTTDANGCYAYDSIRILFKPFAEAIMASSTPNSGTEIEFSAEYSHFTDSLKWVYGDGFEETEALVPGVTTLQKTRTITTTGNYSFYFIAINNCNRDTSNTSSYNIYYAGIDDDVTQNIDIFPNPTNGESFQISNFEQVSTVAIINEIGQLVMSPFKLTSNVVNISNLTEGVYFVEIKDKQGRFTRKKLIVVL